MLHSLSDLENFLSRLAKTFTAKTLLLLAGPMGIGKTKTVELLLKAKGFTGSSSPTFALHQVYRLKNGDEVDHFDLYRIESEDDFESTGFWDVLQKPIGLVLVEWPERLPKKFVAPGWQIIKLEMSWQGESRVAKVTESS